MRRRVATKEPATARERVTMEGSSLRFAIVADTHSRPHQDLDQRLRELAPTRILHAGDIGDPAVLRALERHAPVLAVRGNIDELGLPDVLLLDLVDAKGTLLTLLMTHIAVYGPKLRADVAKRARAADASLVVCGHSHVPFAAQERGLTIFNPGSVGPRRFHLPIVLGVLDVSREGISLRHIDCTTGLPWRP